MDSNRAAQGAPNVSPESADFGIGTTMNHSFEYRLRMPPSEPEPFPVKEPPDPPENPDLPIREPDPEDPGQI